MARVHKVKSVYPTSDPKRAAVIPIVNDEDLNPHVDNTEAMLRAQEHRTKRSVRDGDRRGTFEPTGTNDHYLPNYTGPYDEASAP